MASVWMVRRSGHVKKLQGHLGMGKIVAAFDWWVKRIVKLNPGTTVAHKAQQEAILHLPDGEPLLLYIEAWSPPSAPEQGQPKIQNGVGLVIDGKGQSHSLKVPTDAG